MAFTLLFNQMIQFFLIIALGFFLYRKNFMNQEFNRRLSKILLNVTLPALILNSVLSQTDRPSLENVLYVFAVAVIMYLSLPLAGIIFVHIAPVKKELRGIYAFMTAYANIGFMGFPIIEALYGSTAVLYTTIFNIFFNLSCYTIGTLLLTSGTEDGAKINPSHLLNPGFIVNLCSIMVYFLNPTLPTVLTSTISTIGQVTTPLAMLLIGSTLATNNLKEIFAGKFVYLFALLRQIALPVVLYPVLKLVIQNELIRNVTFIMLLMPVANSAVLFANEYGADEKLASKVVFLTTLLSILTIPAGVYFFL